jgi:anti-sigma regulatory factor (Ser/Thr protein kinase)
MKNRHKSDIFSIVKKNGRISSETLAKEEGISRQAAHKKLTLLVRKGELSKVGSTRGAYYVAFSPEENKRPIKNKAHIRLQLKNKGLQEHAVLEGIERTSDTLNTLPERTKSIFFYAFTEMLNNAIEHSHSKTIYLDIYEEESRICFDIIDAGIGVYNNLMSKFSVRSELEAVQELLKGKRTTYPEKHSGEGIFFTEKISDHFELEGGRTRLIVDNPVNDIAVKEVPVRKGTKVTFKLNRNTRKSMEALFKEYTDEEYRFSKTKVTVRLYQSGVEYVSRSQARRLLFGLEKFSTIFLDFTGIKGIGQGFADEIFRIYKQEHPHTQVVPVNASKTVLFMIKRAAA